MKAPKSAIDYIIKAFKGKEEIGGADGWLVTFQNQEDVENVISLIDMLTGWKAVEHVNILHTVKIATE